MCEGTNYSDKKVTDFTEEDWQIPLLTSFIFEDIKQIAEDGDLDISDLVGEDLDRIGKKFMGLICGYGEWCDDMKVIIQQYIETKKVDG